MVSVKTLKSDRFLRLIFTMPCSERLHFFNVGFPIRFIHFQRIYFFAISFFNGTSSPPHRESEFLLQSGPLFNRSCRRIKLLILSFFVSEGFQNVILNFQQLSFPQTQYHNRLLGYQGFSSLLFVQQKFLHQVNLKQEHLSV